MVLQGQQSAGSGTGRVKLVIGNNPRDQRDYNSAFNPGGSGFIVDELVFGPGGNVPAFSPPQALARSNPRLTGGWEVEGTPTLRWGAPYGTAYWWWTWAPTGHRS
jgi:hypothetical protein